MKGAGGDSTHTLWLAGRRSIFDRFAGYVTRIAGSPWVFSVALGLILIWAMSGPAFHFSDDWQMVVNTGTTIITFLMVFLIQQSQNKDSLALHIKLNELIASQERASNLLISVEDLDEADLATLRQFYSKLADLAKDETDIKTTHSLDDAEVIHANKAKAMKKPAAAKPAKSRRKAVA